MKTLKLLFNTGRGITAAGAAKNRHLAELTEELKTRGAKPLGYGEYDVTNIFSEAEEAEWKQRCRDNQRTYRWHETQTA